MSTENQTWYSKETLEKRAREQADAMKQAERRFEERTKGAPLPPDRKPPKKKPRQPDLFD